MRNLVIILMLVLLPLTGWGYTLESIDTDLNGFVDLRGGVRTRGDDLQKDESLGEARLQLEFNRSGDLVTAQVRADFLYDAIPEDFDLHLDEGKGPIDLRTAYLLFSPADIADMKIGRQILTWGTGDLLFINDLFPKDWQSFFSGRDVEYLKAPSDAIFLSLFPDGVNIDIAYTPKFDADRFISGERFSFWNGSGFSGRDAVVHPEERDAWFDEDEIAIRVSRNFSGYEAAAYGYSGYWKSPNGFDPAAGKAYHPELNVYGFSLRGNLGEGLINIEGGHYDSREDTSGDNPMIPNGEARFLIGYEQEIVRDLSAGVQWYVEHMLKYEAYETSTAAAMPGAPLRDEDRQVLTLRLTKMALNQNLILSLFIYYSPTDKDGYLRPEVKYKWSDALLLAGGGNYFWGEEDHTFFGQFEDASNLYAAVRYSF